MLYLFDNDDDEYYTLLLHLPLLAAVAKSKKYYRAGVLPVNAKKNGRGNKAKEKKGRGSAVITI